MFSSRSFFVLRLTFRSLTHLNLLLYMVWENVQISSFYVLMAGFPSTIYEETIFYPFYMTCLLCHRLVVCKCLGLILGSVSCSVVLSVLCQSYAILITVSLWYSLKSGNMIPPVLLFFFSIWISLEFLKSSNSGVLFMLFFSLLWWHFSTLFLMFLEPHSIMFPGLF